MHSEQRYSVGPGPAYAPSTSSSLAYALGPDAFTQRRPPGYAYPHEECKPVLAHIGAYGPQSLSTFDAGGSSGRMFDGVVACPDEQEFSMHEYPYCPTGPETYPTVIQDHAHTEHGYFQGKIVTTAVLGQAASSTEYGSSPSHEQQTFQGDMNAAPIVMSSPRPPFQTTRSYTLAEAMTPVEDRKPSRPSKFPQAPSVATPAADASRSPSASPSAPTFPMHHSSPYPASPTAMAAAPTPPPSTDAPGLFSKFAANAPFQVVPNSSSPTPLSPHSQLSYDDIGTSDVEGRPTETIIELAVTMPQEPAKKKPTMACLFCRDRKIGCGPPSPDSVDKRCKQCIKRDFKECIFPKESRRGQHKRTPRTARSLAMSSGESASPQDESMPSPLTSPATARSKSKGTTKRDRTPRRATIDVIPHYGGADSAGPSSATF